MADQGRWFKLWVTAPSDPALANLSLENFARWCLFGTYMKIHGKEGTIQLSSPALALQSLLRLPTYSAVIACLHLFPNCTVNGDNGEKQKTSVTLETNVTVTWRNWSKYQGDFSGDRVRNFRMVKRTKKRGEEKRRDKMRKEETRSTLSAEPDSALASAVEEWPAEDFWLKELLSQQTWFPSPSTALYEHAWWDRVSEVVNGLDEAILRPEFARMEAWCKENPRRTPTSRGLRRFIRGWLERRYERERRQHT